MSVELSNEIAKDFITRAEAARILAVCDRSVDRYLTIGRLTKYQQGTFYVRLDRAEVEALKLELQQVQVVAVTAK